MGVLAPVRAGSPANSFRPAAAGADDAIAAGHSLDLPDTGSKGFCFRYAKWSALDEGQEVSVEAILVGDEEPVPRVRVLHIHISRH